MIGVRAPAADPQIVEEFFELFKTPWERAVSGRHYSVVLSTGEPVDDLDADVFLVYSAAAQTPGATRRVSRRGSSFELETGHGSLPIYGPLATFEHAFDVPLATWNSMAADVRDASGERCIWRIGYDLFEEVGRLLTVGQPVVNAAIPTLDRHIELLRRILTRARVPFIEVPPQPDGYDFICCQTHDVDFFGVRRHRADRTIAGFLLRATLGTCLDLVRRRRTFAEVARNFRAAASLPLVHLGLAADFWAPFDDYAQVERPEQSTFFLVPFRNEPGVAPDGHVARERAVPYDVREIGDEVRRALARGSEVGVHGIDAWRDADRGRRECQSLAQFTGDSHPGIRMHWLYWDAAAPRRLEAAGFDYDSTWGYNEAIGYRAGTSQAFRLPGTQDLLELPLTIMDSALFSGRRLGLDLAAAKQRWRHVIAHAGATGGTVVVNWHERSLAPERLWGRHYAALLAEIGEGRRPWFATARRAVDWFRWRRAIRFSIDGDQVVVRCPTAMQPGGIVRVHRATTSGSEFDDMPLNGAIEYRQISLPAPSVHPLSVSAH